MELSREAILAFRRRGGALDTRLPWSAQSLRVAAWAGLQDSMPRAALLSIHARVSGATPSAWEDVSLVQVWGPRYSAYVVSEQDAWIFTLGRLPDAARGRQRAMDTAARLAAHLDGRRMNYETAGDEMGVDPNSLRYATTTGTVRLRWEGARRPLIWTVPAPEQNPREARLELARRYLHVFGPATADSFATWAGVTSAEGRRAFDDSAAELVPVSTPIGDAWALSADEPLLRAERGTPAVARLLPSGDAYFLLQGVDRELLVPDQARRGELWTSRVWPGALLVDGEIVGVWRRADALLSVELWRPLSGRERGAVEAEAASLPLPGLQSEARVNWSG
jgi:hypothetical protein